MPIIRRLLAQRRWAVLICTAALLLKLLVPTGYMLSEQHGRLAITMCSGMDGSMVGMSKASDRPDGDKSKGHGKAGVPCPFASLSAPSLEAIDPVLLFQLFAFIMAVGIVASTRRAAVSRMRLRPPLRAPPIHL